MNGTTNLWNNSYEKDGDFERVLNRLLERERTREEIVRTMLETLVLQSVPATEQFGHQLMEGAAQLLTGNLDPISRAIGARIIEVRQHCEKSDLAQIPTPLVQQATQRADLFLTEGIQNQWIASANAQSWAITNFGRDFLADGGFSMR